MLRRTLQFLSLALLSICAAAQTKITLNGNIQQFTGETPSSRVRLKIDMIQCAPNLPRVAGIAVLGDASRLIAPDASGNFTVQLWPNAAVTCDTVGNSRYQISITKDQSTLWSAVYNIASSPSTQDLSSLSPVAVTVVSPYLSGHSLLNGTGAPSSSAGNDADFYLDTSASCLYGPKASGTWPGACASLIGPPGTPGPAGGITGGTMTGNLFLNADPTAPLQAASWESVYAPARRTMKIATSGWSAYHPWGDSITAGSFADPSSQSYVNQIASATGTTGVLTNLAVSGSNACYQNRNEIFASENPSSTSAILYTYLPGANDAQNILPQVVSSSSLGYEHLFRSVLAAQIAWVAIPSDLKYTGASFGTPPTNWSTDTTFAGGGGATGLQTTTNAAVSSWPITTTVANQRVFIFYRSFSGNSTAASFNYSLDGTYQGTASLYSNSTTLCGVADTVHMVSFSGGGTTGSHTIAITPNLTGGDTASILAVGVAPTSATNPVWVGGTLYYLNDANSDATARTNNDVQQVVSTLQSRDQLYVSFVPTRNWMYGQPSEMPYQLPPTVTGSGTGGTVPAGTYYAKIVPLTSGGSEITSSVDSASVTTTGSTSRIITNWSAPATGAPGGYHVYYGTSAGGENRYFTVSAGVTTYTLTAAITTGTSGTPATFNYAHPWNTGHSELANAFLAPTPLLVANPPIDPTVLNQEYANAANVTYPSSQVIDTQGAATYTLRPGPESTFYKAKLYYFTNTGNPTTFAGANGATGSAVGYVLPANGQAIVLNHGGKIWDLIGVGPVDETQEFLSVRSSSFSTSNTHGTANTFLLCSVSAQTVTLVTYNNQPGKKLKFFNYCAGTWSFTGSTGGTANSLTLANGQGAEVTLFSDSLAWYTTTFTPATASTGTGNAVLSSSPTINNLTVTGSCTGCTGSSAVTMISSSSDVSVSPGTTSEVYICGMKIPAGTMSGTQDATGSHVEGKVLVSATTAATGTVTFRLSIGPNNSMTGISTLLQAAAIGGSAGTRFLEFRYNCNNRTSSSQICSATSNAAGASPGLNSLTGTVNTAADMYLIVSASMTVGTDGPLVCKYENAEVK